MAKVKMQQVGYQQSIERIEKTREGYPLLIPSGYVVYVRGLSPSMFVMGGIDIPDFLADVVAEAMAKGIPENLSKPETSEGLARLKKWAHLMGIVIKKAVVKPRIVDDNPASGEELALYELQIEDMQVIFQACFQPAYDLERFCTEYSAYVESIHAGEDLQNEAEPVDQPETESTAG